MAQQIDPAGRHRRDVNANAQGPENTKQPGNLPEDTATHGPDAKGAAPLGERATTHKTGHKQGHKTVRDAGPGEMENPPRTWDITDEEGDESFPASDPPANY